MANPFTPDPLGSTWPAPFPWLSFGFSGPVPGFSLETTVQPTDEPVSIAEAKRNAKVDHSDDDDLFGIWVTAARRLVEREAGICIKEQTLRLSLPCWPLDGKVELPVGPAQSVSSVKYYAANGTLTTLAANTDYQTWLAYRPGLILPAPQKFWPAVQFGRVPAVIVEYVAAAADAADLAIAKAAVLMAVDYWSFNSGDVDAPEQLGLSQGCLRLIRAISATGYR